MRTWFRRVWHLVNRRRHERDLVREMHQHRASMHDPSAFGDPHRLLEQSRDYLLTEAGMLPDWAAARATV